MINSLKNDNLNNQSSMILSQYPSMNVKLNGVDPKMTIGTICNQTQNQNFDQASSGVIEQINTNIGNIDHIRNGALKK